MFKWANNFRSPKPSNTDCHITGWTEASAGERENVSNKTAPKGCQLQTKAAQCIMAIIEEGKAAKRSDSFLDYISKMKADHDEKIASLDWRIGFAFITISELAKTATDEQVEILLDLCKVLHDGIPDERN